MIIRLGIEELPFPNAPAVRGTALVARSLGLTSLANSHLSGYIEANDTEVKLIATTNGVETALTIDTSVTLLLVSGNYETDE